MSAMPLMTSVSLATSNLSGHRIVCVPVRASGAISAITTRRPCCARRVAVAAPMPRLPPVTRTMPSAIMIVAFATRSEQSSGNQLLVGRDHMIRHRGDGAAGIGITAAEVSARAHEHVNDGFEFLVAEIVDRAGMPRAPQDSDIGRRDIVEVLLVADRCKKLGLVEDAQEFRDLPDEIEECAKSLEFLPRRVRGTGSLPDETDHFCADHGQQLIQQLLTILKMIVKRALRDAGLLGDAGDGGFGVTVFADDFGRGVEHLALGPCIALDAVEFCQLSSCSFGYLCHALASNSAHSTRLSTLPEGLRGRLSRMISCFGTLNDARRW